ncbi:DNA topoisomerase, partial [Salmonella enterica subsp. enterica serovar Virginia]|nr:DNA topoisomerase [Salmonella enterica subsp. enterica serovar Virginia]
ESLSAGIGTPATRSAIVKNIIDKGYITVDKKKLRTTEKGRLLCSALEGSLISSAEMTGKWEEKLKFISDGKETQQNFIEDIEIFIQQLFKDIPAMVNENVKTSTLESVKQSEGKGLGICPKCNKGYI